MTRNSDTLKDIAKYLGKFREIVAQGRRNGYAYGRGENYSLELGNSLSRPLSSEFALIHFASSKSCQVDLFLPGAYTAEDKMKAAETFLSGGTSFERPLREAVRLMEEQGFEKADIVFLTDGKCELPEDYAQELGEIQKARRFTMTGVLFGEAGARAEFSLAGFCQQVYEVGTQLDGDVVRRVIGNR